MKQSQSQNLYSGDDLWNRREIRLWHATTLLNDDKLFAYNSRSSQEEHEKIVKVIDIGKSLTVGEFQPAIVLPTGIEAVKICYHDETNSVVVVGNKNNV